ncbi:hypothetical protein Tco_0605231, partial [Tanacetum coccineum]
MSISCLAYELYLNFLSRNKNPIASQQAALDNSLVAPEKRLKIERCNARIDFTKPKKEEIYQVTLEALKLSSCYPTFQITAEVPEIYMHQFWNTIKKIGKKDAYDFKLDKKKCRVNTEAKALKENAKSTKPITAMTVYPPNTPAKLVPKVIPTKNAFYTATDSVLTVSIFSDMHDAYTVAQKRIAELEAENSNMTQKIQKDDHDEMIKHFSKLEVEYLNLQLKYQHIKERFGNKKSVTSSDAPAFELVFEIGNLKEQLQGRGNTIRELKEKISRLQKKHSEADLILDFKALDSQNKDFKCKRNNGEVHSEYLKHLKESVGTLREIVEEARVEEPLDSPLASACLYTKHSQELLEYVIGTRPKDFNKRDRKIATAPLNRKKRVTFVEPGVKDATAASGSKPRSNTKKDRTLPAKSDKKKVEDHYRNNKSSVKQKNRIDSSISYKRTIINSNSNSICKTCNKCLMSFNHDKCVVKSLKYAKKPPVNKVLRVKPVKQVWQATGKLFNNVRFQWQPTGRKFTLGEHYPLTRFTESKVVPVKQPKSVVHIVLWYLDSGFSKHMMGDRSQLRNFVKKFIGTVRFENDHLGAIMGYGDYVIGDS